MMQKSPDYEMMRYDRYQYRRSRRDREDLRGTLLFHDPSGAHIVQKVPGFPAIKRSYRLREGVTRLFGNACFRAEEKLDGYNARIFKHNDKFFGATRGGFICPFTTDWARIWAEDRNLAGFFRDYPEYVLCGEVCGDNPYNWQRDPELPAGAHFFIFEIVSPDGVFLAPETRYDIIERYNLPGVTAIGKFSRVETDKLYEVLRDLNHRHREGVVLKDMDGRSRMKFVTPNTDIQDLRDTLRIGFDLDPGYFFNRYLRASVFVREFGLNEEEYAQRIGRAFLEGIPDPGDFSEASENFVIHVTEKRTWEQLRDMLKPHVLIKRDEMGPVEINGRKMLRVGFRRVYQKSSHKYRRILKGHLHQD